MVFESGLGEGMEAWDSVVTPVAAFARAVTYDRRGRRRSTGATGRFDLGQAIDDLRAVIEAHAGADRVILVGHSIGGAYVTAFANRHPDRVRALILVDPTPAGFFEEQRRIIGSERLSVNHAATLSRLTRSARAEYEAMPTSLAQAAGGRWNAGSGRVISAGRIENPDVAIGRRTKAVWLDLHARMAEAMGLRHHIVETAGHRIQDQVPDVEVESVRDAVAGSGR